MGKNDFCVYLHTFPNGKVYVGQTRQKPEYRFNNGNGYKGCRRMYNAIQKYGWENVKHNILADGLSRTEADYYEKYYIEFYKSNDTANGYNLRTGGTEGYEYNEEAREKISRFQKGRKQTEEQRAKRSVSLKKYYAEHGVSEETRAKLRRTEEQKKQMSERAKSRERKPEEIEALKPYQFKKGHPASEKAIETLKLKLSKRVVQYDFSMNKIAEYSSIAEASRAIGMTNNAVGNCVRGHSKTCGGYIWRYSSDESEI